MDGRLHFRETFLDLVGNADDVDLDPPTGWAGDEGHAAIAQFKRTQNLIGNGNLFLWLRAQAHANGIANTIRQQQAQANGGFDRP